VSGDASCCVGGRHGEGVVAEADYQVKVSPPCLDAVDSEMILVGGEHGLPPWSGIPAGHRPRTCTWVRSDPCLLRYFRAVLTTQAHGPLETLRYSAAVSLTCLHPFPPEIEWIPRPQGSRGAPGVSPL
jgi:hypothetical protein